MIRRPIAVAAATLLAWLAAAPAVFSQEAATRAEADRERRAEKARSTTPHRARRLRARDALRRGPRDLPHRP